MGVRKSSKGKETPMTVTLETRDYILRVERDPYPTNPATDYDLTWNIVSFSGYWRDSLTTDEDRDRYFPESENLIARYPTLALRRKLALGTSFIVDRNCYDHTWTLAPHNDDWERVDGIALFDHKPSEMGAKTVEDRADDAKGFLTEYNAWITGDCYQYSVWPRESDEYGDRADACCGFLMNEWFVDMLRTELLPSLANDNPIRVKVIDANGVLHYTAGLDGLPNVEIVKVWDDSADGEEIDEY